MKQKVVVSAHKVGSTWLTNILRIYYECIEKDVPKPYRQIDCIPGLVDLNAEGVTDYFKSLSTIQVLKSHCYPPDYDANVWSAADIFYIYRDPRDIAVSNAYYLSNLSADMGGWLKLKDMSIDERLICYLEESYHDLRLLEHWFKNEQAMKLSYEQLISSPVKYLANVMTENGFDVNWQLLETAIEKCDFKRMSNGREAGQQCDKSFFRKGITGDWKNHFTTPVKDSFKDAQSGRWNDVLLKYGYETTVEW